MRIANLNPNTQIGASGWFVDIDGHKLLMDAGMHPKLEGRASLPLYDSIQDEEVEAIAISHCHHDHVGSLPVAVRHFPRAHVLMTELSYFIVERVLHNSVNVMKKQKNELNISDYPLFSHEEVDEIEHVFQGFKYNREIEWASVDRLRAGFPSPTLEFLDAGHALGSAGMMVRGQKETLFYTGDVCFQDQTILRGAQFADVKADVMIMETTRGLREVPPDFSREKEIDRLVDAIHQAHRLKGAILIPSFALGRTQEILALLSLLMRQGRLKRQPVYVGGLGRVFTEIYDLEAHRANRNHTNLKLTEDLNLVVLEKGQADVMKLKGGRLFVVTAGMMNENTAAHDLAVRMIEDPKQSVFFVGYADPSTPAGRLRAARADETFEFSSKGGSLTRKCNLQEFDLTAHANRDELLDFVGQVGPRTILLGHGEDGARDWFEKQINERWPQIKVIQPNPGETYKV